MPQELATANMVFLVEEFDQSEKCAGIEAYELVSCSDDEDDQETDLDLFKHLTDKYDEQTKAAEEETIEVNLGTTKELKPILISASLNPEEQAEMVQILKEFVDVLAFKYEYMPDLQSALVEHLLPLNCGAKLVKQKLR